MNKLQTNTGGHRLKTENLIYIQSSIAQALLGIVSIYGGNVILSGCERSDTTITLGEDEIPAYAFAAGYVAINGEICLFEGQTIAQDTYEDSAFVIQQSVAEPQVLYKDGIEKDAYLIRKAIIDPEGANLPDFDRVRYLAPSQWANLSTVGGVSQSVPIQYRRFFDQIELQGRFRVVAAIGGDGKITSAPLPVDMRPAFDTEFIVHAFPWDDSINDSCKITLSADGHIYITPAFYTGASRWIYLNGFRVSIQQSAG